MNFSCKTAGLTSHVSSTEKGERERQLSKEILRAKHGVETFLHELVFVSRCYCTSAQQLINTETLLPALPT